MDLDLDRRQRLWQLRLEAERLQQSPPADKKTALAEIHRLATRFAALLETLQNQDNPERS